MFVVFSSPAGQRLEYIPSKVTCEPLVIIDAWQIDVFPFIQLLEGL
jgi:hypothetical protein